MPPIFQGHFLLTQLLLNTLLETATREGVEGRIVIVAAASHQEPYQEGIRFDNLDRPEGYDPIWAYGCVSDPSLPPAPPPRSLRIAPRPWICALVCA